MRDQKAATSPWLGLVPKQISADDRTILGKIFLAGVAVGVSACLTFAINTSRVLLVRQVVDRRSHRGRVDTTIAHQEVLAKYGSSS
jgi:hypothetical protein